MFYRLQSVWTMFEISVSPFLDIPGTTMDLFSKSLKRYSA